MDTGLACAPQRMRTFAARPGLPIDLLITPHFGTRPSQLADRIRNAVGVDEATGDTESLQDGDEDSDTEESELVAPRAVEAPVGPFEAGHEIAFNQTNVVARLHFDELIQHVVPMSRWFERNIGGSLEDLHKLSKSKSKTNKTRLETAQRDISKTTVHPESLPPLVAWWLRLTGYFSLLLEDPAEKNPAPEAVWDRALELLPSHVAKESESASPANGRTPRLFRIALNRRASAASQDAVRVVKGDAANTVFGIDTSNICWAVLDAGIDIRHKAFFDENDKTRIIDSYDFTRVRRLISLASNPNSAAEATLQNEFGITAASARQLRQRAPERGRH